MGRASLLYRKRLRSWTTPSLYIQLHELPGTKPDTMHTYIETLGVKIYREIAQNFPVVSASDEFFYFPQVQSENPDWTVWDRFCPELITEFAGKLSGFENEIEAITSTNSPAEAGHDACIQLLKKVLRTLREHLVFIRAWETQPSMYLTIACLGLAQALEQGTEQAAKRARTLPQFLEQAGHNLKNVPACFRDVGLEMIQDTRQYLVMLQKELPALADSLAALDRFGEKLKTIPTHSQFRLPEEELSQVVQQHINCGMGISQADEVLDCEIESLNRVLAQEARAMGHTTWKEAYAEILLPQLGTDGLVGLYREEVLALGGHCKKLGLVSEGFYHANPVRVMPVPNYLSAIRAASSYSIWPGHPPAGGVFHVFNAHDPDEAYKDFTKEYRLLAAHETWPGHHLLDINRWSLDSPVLRAVEQPVFYEGWACFAEQMLKMTGYTCDPGDRLIGAKRRLWRAIRGKIDLGLQTGAMSMDRAAQLLTQTGMTREQAMSSARKYILNPGYQLCYTVGLRHFLDLYQGFGSSDLAGFVQVVFKHGEICFQDLERILMIHKDGTG